MPLKSVKFTAFGAKSKGSDKWRPRPRMAAPTHRLCCPTEPVYRQGLLVRADGRLTLGNAPGICDMLSASARYAV